MQRTIKTRVLDCKPAQSPCPPSGMAYSAGTCLVVFEVRGEDGWEDGYYSCLEGVGDDGNFYQTDDFGPHATPELAEAAALEFFDACVNESEEHASCSINFFEVKGTMSKIILLNFSHPLSSAQLERIKELTSSEIERVVEVHTQVDTQSALVPQIVELVERTYLTKKDWQSALIVVNPPGLSSVAFPLLVELYGRYGYFPNMLRMRPVPNSTPPRYEPAEVISLQALCDESRKRRV